MQAHEIKVSAMYDANAKGDRPSIALEKLMRAMLLQVLYSIRSERQLLRFANFANKAAGTSFRSRPGTDARRYKLLETVVGRAGVISRSARRPRLHQHQ